MAPVKFGLFKARSRDYQEQPSTENLLHTSNSSDQVATPSSPVASTSKSLLEDDPPDLSVLTLDDDDLSQDLSQQQMPTRRLSDSSLLENPHMNYKPLKNQHSADATSTLTLNSDPDDSIDDDAATSCDAVSLQFDQASIAPSEDLSVYCGTMKKNKKTKSRREKTLRDFDMWQASNVEVMRNLLSKSGTLDDQIKWEAIATSRGLCILKDSCTCNDCVRAKYLTGVADGDAGMASAPFFSFFFI